MSDRSIEIALRLQIADFQRNAAVVSTQTRDMQGRFIAADAASRGLEQGLGGAGTSARSLRGDLMAMDAQGEKSRQGLATLGGAAGKFGLAAAVGLGLSAKAAADWETAWTGVTKTVNETATTSLPQLEEQLRELARTLPTTHAEIAGVAEAAGQLGIGADDVAAFTRTMIDLGETTNLSADEAATSLARFSNIMGTSAGDVDRLGSTLVGLGNNFATTEAEILAMSMRLAGAGRQAGLNEAEIMGLSAAMSSVGIEAEAGGTAMSLTMKRIGKEVDAGGAKLELFAETSGMTVEQFSTAWENDTAGALTAFVSGLGEAEASGKSTNAVLAELGITGIREADALLRLSGAADTMAGSFDLATKAFDENSALSEEAQKRYETSASKAAIAVNNIKDAAIDFGAVVLPVFAEGAAAAGDFAHTIGGLPGPMKAVTSGALAIVAVLGGGLWFTSKVVNGIAATNLALGRVGITSQITAASMGATAAKLGILAIGLGAINDSMSIYDSMKRSGEAADATADSVESLTSALTDSNVGKWANDLGIDVGRLTADLANNGAQGEYASEVMAQLDKDSSGFGATLNAMAGGVLPFYTAGADKAYDANKDLLEIIDGMDPSLRAAAFAAQVEANALLGATGAGGEFAQANEKAAATSAKSAEAAQVQADALQEVRGAARDSAAAFFDFSLGTDEAATSLSEWLTQLEDQASALRNFTQNTIDAGEKGVSEGLIDHLRELGPEGAKQMKWLADATEEEIGRANADFKSYERGLKDLADVTTGVPALNIRVQDKEGRERIASIQSLMDKFGMTKAEAKAFIHDAATDKITAIQNLVDHYGITRAEAKALLNDLATSPINQVRATLRGLDGDVATVTVRTNHINTFGGRGDDPSAPLATRSADGGTVPKSGLGYADRYLYLLADGEEVISNRNGEADAYRAASGIPPARRLAKGGTAGPSALGYRQDSGGFFVQAVDGATESMKKLSQRLKESEKALAAEKQQRDAALSLRSQVGSSLAGDLFGNGLAGFDLANTANKNDANAMIQALAKAAGKGLDGPLFDLLAASGDLQTVQQFAGLSRKQIDRRERDFRSTRRVEGNLGDLAVEEKFGKSVDQMSSEIRHLGTVVSQLDRKIEVATEKGSRKGTRAGSSDRSRRTSQRARASR